MNVFLVEFVRQVVHSRFPFLLKISLKFPSNIVCIVDYVMKIVQMMRLLKWWDVYILSKNIATIYIIQWFLIPFCYLWIFIFDDGFVFTKISIILVAIIILILSLSLIVAFRKLKQYIMKINYFNSLSK